MLIIAYILIVTVLLYVVCKHIIRLPVWVDIFYIGIVVWFGIALWFAPNHYHGWPLSEDPPDMTYVKDYIVSEPTQQSKGAIYVFGVSYMTADNQPIYDPRGLLKLDIKPGVPRLYKLPYNKEQQKKLQQKRNKSQFMFFRSGAGGKQRKERQGKQKEKDGFKLINLEEILKKEGETP